MTTPLRIVLREDEIPRRWYNIQADLPTPLRPSLNPATGRPVQPEDLAPVFPMNLIEQEASRERWIAIPDEVLEKLALWRPTPLHRARALEEALGTRAHIYYKNEGVSPPSSHKPNTSVAQAYYNKQFGIKRLTTETGAGQWGSALAMACCLFGLECKVYMVRISFDQKPFRKLMMQAWGGQCVASPSPETNAGRKALAERPDTPGSLGLAISEAIEDAVTSKDTRYSLGSVLNHVLLHQTVIGLAARALHQLECYEAAVLFARTEGFIPAPETAHAIAAVVQEARRADEEGRERAILFNWSGHGLMDLAAYDAYFGGRLADYALPEAELRRSLAALEGLPKPAET